jgi:RNA polymerase sigma-70 factor (ECF subfamily)
LINRFYKDHAKNSRRAISVPIDEAEDLFLFQRLQNAGASREGEDPLGTLFDQVDTDAVQSALERLPEEFRSVAVLYFMNDFDYQQIADVLEVPIGTVRSRLHRARKLLQRALWQIALDRGIVEEGVPLG